MRTYRVQVVQEFYVDTESIEDAERAVQVFMTGIAEADNKLPAPYSWDFADWSIVEQ